MKSRWNTNKKIEGPEINCKFCWNKTSDWLILSVTWHVWYKQITDWTCTWTNLMNFLGRKYIRMHRNRLGNVMSSINIQQISFLACQLRNQISDRLWQSKTWFMLSHNLGKTAKNGAISDHIFLEIWRKEP